MSESSRIAARISSYCNGLWLRHYISSKVQTDPLYDGVYNELKNSKFPLLDIGCGIGILAMYMRERGWQNPVTGFDFDASKIKAGHSMIAAGSYTNIHLNQGDARRDLPDHCGDVAILDILQFIGDEEKRPLLKSAATRVAPGGILIIRSGIQEKSLRFYTTLIVDMFAKLTFWMKAAPTNYPTKDFFQNVLEAEGLKVEICPFWGKTPFNNYLILARRPEQ